MFILHFIFFYSSIWTRASKKKTKNVVSIEQVDRVVVKFGLLGELSEFKAAILDELYE